MFENLHDKPELWAALVGVAAIGFLVLVVFFLQDVSTSHTRCFPTSSEFASQMAMILCQQTTTSAKQRIPWEVAFLCALGGAFGIGLYKFWRTRKNA